MSGRNNSGIFKSGGYDSGWNSPSESDDMNDEFTWGRASGGTSSRRDSGTGDGVRYTDAGGRGERGWSNPQLTRVLLSEATRRHDRQTMTQVEKSLEVR